MTKKNVDSRHASLSPQVSVFVSSTWRDLQNERKAVEEALRRLDAIKFKGMEYFGSRNESTRRASLDEVDRAQIYIGIFAGRYGSGITEGEYRRACRQELECFIYFKREESIDDQYPELDKQDTVKLDILKNDLRKSHTIYFFSTPDELARQVMADISNWLYRNYLPAQIEFALSGNLPRDKANDLLKAIGGSIRDLRSFNPSVVEQLHVAGILADLNDDKLLKYVAKLRDDPEFAEWNPQRYFELQLDFKIRMRLKYLPEGEATDQTDKYTVQEAIKKFRRLVIIGEPGSGKLERQLGREREQRLIPCRFTSGCRISTRCPVLPMSVLLR